MVTRAVVFDSSKNVLETCYQWGQSFKGKVSFESFFDGLSVYHQ